MATQAVFFDVDFTLIYPGPTFDASGYRSFGERHGLSVDTARFDTAVAAASRALEVGKDPSYRRELFVRFGRRVIEEMGGRGPGLDACAQEIYDEWAVCENFSLYDDVKPALRQLHERGLRLGLISNTHRCLDSFRSHFDLESFITGAVSVFRPRVHEAAPEHLQGGASRARCGGGGGAHGRRQRQP